jgi:hypothetical protein
MAMPKWRPFTWVILVINALFLIWIISGIAGNSSNCSGLSGQELDTCQSATAVGTGIGVAIIVVFWALVDVILGVIWLVTRRKGRSCPVCGNDVKRGLTRCSSCGYDFAAGVAQAQQAGPQVPAPPPSA